jgi:diketogulonate reductase-like aldo/keto reductase
VKDIGVSCYGVHHLKELLEWDELKVKPSVNQIEVNPWLQHEDITEFCKDHGIVIETFSPLMAGQRLDDPELVSLSQKYKKTVAQILIRWNLQKGFVPLPKSVRESRLRENLNVFDFELSSEDVESIGDKSAYFVTVEDWDPTVWQ